MEHSSTFLNPAEDFFATSSFHFPDGTPSSRPAQGRQPLRVAAYIRVSTDSRRQEDSYQRQEEHFCRFFANHPEWQPVGIYSDYGLSATSKQKRIGFCRLLRHCREGKVQRIYCKSISRFARNTGDFMEALSALKEGGATIYFETEHLDTAYYTNEFILTTLAALAQEESRSLSENVRWGIQKHYMTGEVKNLPIYGYRYAGFSENSRLPEVEVVQSQAQVVRWVFEQAAQGQSFSSIAKSLNQAQIPPPQTIWSRKHKRQREKTPPKLGELRDEIAVGWTGEQISRMLQNERYIGDLLLQKKYKASFLSPQLKINRGELPKYRVENHHPPIVNRLLFNQVQQRFSSSRETAVSCFHPFSRRLVCAHCGRFYTVRSSNRRSIWYCPTAKSSNGISVCHGTTYPETLLYSMFFQGLLLRFLFSPNIVVSYFSSLASRPWECITQLIPKLQSALENFEHWDQIEFQRSLLKKQILAVELALQRYDRACSKTVAKRIELLQQKMRLEKTLEEKETYWEQIEQGYSQRKRLNGFFNQSKEEKVEEWLAHLVQPLTLSIHLFSSNRFWIHWFDDTYTRLTLSGSGNLLSFDHLRPADSGAFLRESGWKA